MSQFSLVSAWVHVGLGERMLPVIRVPLPSCWGTPRSCFLRDLLFLMGVNETNQKRVLLFGAFYRDGTQFQADAASPRHVHMYLIGFFGSNTLSIIYRTVPAIPVATQRRSAHVLLLDLASTFFSVGNITGVSAVRWHLRIFPERQRSWPC